MKLIISTTPVSRNKLYKRIYAAIQQEKSITGKKPSLVQISRQDYQKLIISVSPKATLGLSIDNVSVVSFDDVERGNFYLLP